MNDIRFGGEYDDTLHIRGYDRRIIRYVPSPESKVLNIPIDTERDVWMRVIPSKLCELE